MKWLRQEAREEVKAICQSSKNIRHTVIRTPAKAVWVSKGAGRSKAPRCFTSCAMIKI